MFDLRKEHVDSLRVAAIRRYEDRVVVHLRKCFPKRLKGVDESELRSLVREGMEKARVYGFSTEREVCLFIDIMVEYGRTFDQDPNLPWAAAILHNEEDDPADKIDRLFSFAVASRDPEYSQKIREEWEKLL